jgi:outer membrane lipoprotein SlyB
MKFRYAILVLMILLTGCSTPLTTREKGAGIGTLGGAAAGGIIGSAVGHAGAGAAIGGLLGLGAGGLIGDQLQGQEMKHEEQQRQIDRDQTEIERQQSELDKLNNDRSY